MPSRIPRCIADKPIPSMNQARVHYLKILYRYQKGQSVNEQDRQEVEQLMTSSGTVVPVREEPHDVRVVRGHFGRTCFARCSGGESPQMISITRSLKQCVAPYRDNPSSQSMVPTAETPLDVDVDVHASFGETGKTSPKAKKTKSCSPPNTSSSSRFRTTTIR